MSDVPAITLGSIGEGFLAVLEITDGPTSQAWCEERGIADRIGLGHQRAVPSDTSYAGANARWFFRSPAPVATRELAPGVVLRGDGVITTAEPWVWRKRLEVWPELPPWIEYAEPREYIEEPEALPAEPDDTYADAPLPAEPVRAIGDGNLARGDAPELAMLLLAQVQGDSLVRPVHDGVALWRYVATRGVWEIVDDAEQYRIVARYAGTPAGLPPKPLKLSDSAISGALKAARAEVTDKGFFNSETPGLAFANGFATVRDSDVVLLAHAPEHRARHVLDMPFDLEARAPGWIQFLEDVWRDFSEEDRAARVAFIEEWIGAALLGLGTTYQRSLILVGDAGANGKSTMLSVVRELFPADSVRSSGPQQWSNNFFLAELAGARVNIVNELPDADVEAGETFKAVISGDEVTAARKHRDPFRFSPRAAHVFACNALPGTRDQSGGFWRRQGILTFPRTFEEHEQDRELSAKLRKEAPAITAHVLRAAVRLIQRGSYALPQSSIDALEEWREDSDQVRQWLRECCDEDADAESTLADLYPIYAGWSRAHGHKALASNKLGGRLKTLKLAHRTTLGRYYRVKVKPQASAKYRTGA